MAEQRPNGLQVHRPRGCSDSPERDGAVGTAGDEGTGIGETRMGKLTDVEVLEMTK